MSRSALLLLLWVPVCLLGEDASFPLEAVKISGSQVPTAVVMEMSGLKLGANVNKLNIEDACQKLGQSGIFEAVSYKYQPGPKKGYIVTLELADPRKLSDASFDIPGADEKALWAWISGQFPAFQHRVPQSEDAQQYLAGMVERKLGADVLHGQHLVVRMEQDFSRGRQLLSFQPQNLPHIAQMNFSGQSRLTAEELTALMQKVVGNDGYMDRRFRNLVELNLRRAYEEHGMYKVQFPSIQAKEVDAGNVSVTTSIVEGLQYKLADVQLLGNDLPAEEMLAAGKFQKGIVANWTEIQQGVWRTETPLKRTGYMEAVSQPERVLDDATQTLVLKIAYRKGALYRFGDVAFSGLSPDLEAKARSVWKMQTGAPYDFMYSGDFLGEFSKVVDLRWVKRVNPKMEPGVGDHVRNVRVIFESK